MAAKFIPNPGTYAALQLADRLAAEVSVLDYGAYADGTTNDATAFAAANAYLQTIGGGTILVPRVASGNYHITELVYVDSNITIKGLGKPLIDIDESSPGGIVPRPRSTTGAISAGSRSLVVGSATGMDVGDVLTVEAAGGATTVQATTLTTGINSTINEIALASVTGLSTAGTMLIGGTEIIRYTGISTLTLTGVTRGQLGTTAAAHLSGATADTVNSLNAQIEAVSGTTITLVETAVFGVSAAEVETGSANVMITGLQLNGNRNLVTPPNANPHPILIRAGSNVIVNDCVIYNGDHSAVFIDRGSRNCTVQNCDFYDIGIPLSDLGSAIWLWGGTRNCTIDNNRIWGDTSHGITVDDRSSTHDMYDGSPRNNAITRNKINLSRSTSAAPDGIVFNGTIGSIVTGNTVIGKGTNSRGIVIGSGGQGFVPLANQDNYVHDNVIEDCHYGIVGSEANGARWGQNVFRNCTVDRDLYERTISSGVLIVSYDDHTVDTEADAETDDIDTINGGYDGQIITLRPANVFRQPTIKTGTGNILCPADRPLNAINTSIQLQYDSSYWREVSYTAFTPTVFRRYVQFDGVNDYGSLATPQNLGTEFTIAFWAKSTDTSWGGPGNNGGDYLFLRDASNINITIVSGATGTWAHTQTSDWTHYCITRNGTTVTCYVDGVSLGTSTVSSSAATWGFLGSFAAFAGGMYDLRTYSVEKSAGEVDAIFDGTNDLTSIVGYWPMDDGSGGIAANSVGGGIAIDWNGIDSGFHVVEVV